VIAYDVHDNWKEVLTNMTSEDADQEETLSRMKVAKSLEEVKKEHLVVSSLPDGVAATKVAEGLSGSEGVWVECSTIGPRIASTLPSLSKRRVVDAPVSGGIVGARNGTLCFMAGGESRDIDEAQEALSSMGKIVRAGALGSGNAAKLCNNLLLGITMIGASEALALGKRLGVDPKVLTDIISVSAGRCWSVDTYNPVPGVGPDHLPANNEYNGGFATGLMSKDLKLAHEEAIHSGFQLYLGDIVNDM